MAGVAYSINSSVRASNECDLLTGPDLNHS